MVHRDSWGQGQTEWMTHTFSIDDTKFFSKSTRMGITWTFAGRVHKRQQSQVLYKWAVVQYALHPEMATNIGQAEVMEKKFPS